MGHRGVDACYLGKGCEQRRTQRWGRKSPLSEESIRWDSASGVQQLNISCTGEDRLLEMVANFKFSGIDDELWLL